MKSGRSWKRWSVAALAIAALLVSSALAAASFGTHGKRVISGLGVVWDAIPYGKSRTLLLSSGRGPEYEITRLRSNGSVDRGFGEDGHAAVAGEVFAVQPDGGVLVLSTGRTPGGEGSDALLTRLLPDGQLDRSFGHEGKLTVDLGNRYDTGAAMTVLPGGKIAIAGQSGARIEPRAGVIDGDPVVARLLPGGALDPGFGDDGRVVLPEAQEPAALRAGPRGSLYLQDGQFNRLIRLNRTGAPDSSFGSHGVVGIPQTVDPPETSFLAQGDFAILPRGGALIAGTLSSSANHYRRSTVGVLRLRSDGSPAPSFGDGGFARVGFRGGSTFVAGIAATRDGRSVIVGSAQVPLGKRSRLSAIALTPSGKLDRRFARGGKLMVKFDDWVIGQDLFLRGGRAFLVGGARGPETLLAQVPLSRHR